MKLRSLVLLICVFALSAESLVIAQDAATDDVIAGTDVTWINWNDPNPQQLTDISADANIEDVTNDSADYYGSVVTLEGEIGDFINSRMFALGEGATLDNDLVLVVNNSTQSFSPEIMKEAHVTVTGRVHPSLIAIQEGAQTDFGALFTAEGTNAENTAMMNDDYNRAGENLAGVNYWDADEDAVVILNELDRNLETLDENLRAETAQTLDNTAADLEGNHPEIAQSLRDAAASLRENDIERARTSLQSTTQNLNTMQNQNMQQGNQMQGSSNRVNMVEWAQQGLIPQGLENYTIIEILNVDNVQFIDFAQDEIGN
ncbi:MAG: hypothetical protein K8L99_09295 [Anaerolineae bacterium]|nr:hypothetical protein [Anaerolineae bacterium]